MRLLLIILIFYANTSSSQSSKANQSNQAHKKEAVNKKKNNAEQEEYYVKKMFQEEYKKQNFDRFLGIITVVNNNLQYDSLIISVSYTSADLKTILSEGLLYPKLFGNDDSLRITDFQELKYVNDNPQYKRFSFWLFRKWLLNPQVYYIELTNDKSTPETDLREFNKGARLTYFKPGSIII